MWLFFSFTLLSWDRKAGGAQVQGISVPPLFMFPRLLLNKRALCSRAVGGWGYLQGVTQLIYSSESMRWPFKAFTKCLAFKTNKQKPVKCQSNYATCKKKKCGMKTCIQIWKSVFPCLRFAVVQATDSTGTHTKGKAHRYHSKATMKALNSNVYVHQSKIKCEFY